VRAGGRSGHAAARRSVDHQHVRARNRRTAQLRLVDWDRVDVGPFSYDLSTFLFRFPAEQRPGVLECYRDGAARGGWELGSPEDLALLFDTAERARYANRVIWPAVALLQEPAAWG